MILVGEIRDQETADIALQAAQTGHLLLSTLHTNDAPGDHHASVRPRHSAVSRRLVAARHRRAAARAPQPCPSCAVPETPSADDDRKGRRSLPAAARRDDGSPGKGCAQCDQSGFKGRIAIHEVLEITDEVRELISSRGSEQAIRKAARRAGMRTLFEDGLEKAARGLTTLDEVLRVTSPRTQRVGNAASPVRRRRLPLRQLPAAATPTVRIGAKPTDRPSPARARRRRQRNDRVGREVLPRARRLRGASRRRWSGWPRDRAAGAPRHHRQRRQHAGHGRRGHGEGASRRCRSCRTCAS